MIISDICGWLGFICGIMINIPQLFKIYKTKIVDGISIYTYVLIFLTCLFYAIPAIYTGMWHFILTNVIGMFTSIAVIIMVFKYRKGVK